MLMSRSPVFMAMFQWPPPPHMDPTLTEKGGGEDEIMIDDADPDAFYQVLRYFCYYIIIRGAIIIEIWSCCLILEFKNSTATGFRVVMTPTIRMRSIKY